MSDNIYASTGDAVHTKQKSVAEKLNLITDFLFKLLKQVELIRTYTEQVGTQQSLSVICAG